MYNFSFSLFISTHVQVSSLVSSVIPPGTRKSLTKFACQRAKPYIPFTAVHIPIQCNVIICNVRRSRSNSWRPRYLYTTRHYYIIFHMSMLVQQYIELVSRLQIHVMQIAEQCDFCLAYRRTYGYSLTCTTFANCNSYVRPNTCFIWYEEMIVRYFPDTQQDTVQVPTFCGHFINNNLA